MIKPFTWPPKRKPDTSRNESPALRRQEPTQMGSCTIMPMIPTAWFSSGNFRTAIHAMTFATCTPVQTFGGMGEGIFQNDCWYHAGEAPMALKRRGAVIFLVFQSIWGAMKREIMIHSQDQILRVFLYFSIRKPSISVIIKAI